MGHEIESEITRVVGIGDMSGDVFGNGMLLSKTLQLNAAFNHLHIFLDRIQILNSVGKNVTFSFR